jgi:membrane associated rhomboid family serine protease
MGYRGSQGGGSPMQFGMTMPLTPAVRGLLIANVSIWLIAQLIIGKVIMGEPDLLIRIFGLVPFSVVKSFFLWQVVTYMFLHALNPFHILFNMLLLWWLGAELESRWGSRFFLVYYFVSGIGAALLYLAGVTLYALFNSGAAPIWSVPVVGASGALFGLMLAYGVIFGERIVYFAMIFPMRAKYFVAILGTFEAVTLLNNGFGSDVANLAHLGGLASGYIFLKVYTRFQQDQWRKKTGRRGRGLKLVVDNEKKKRDPNGPRYWN